MIKFELRNLSPLMLNSLTEENYLKALFALSKETDEVTVNELSKQLGIKMPTVTSMMKHGNQLMKQGPRKNTR